MSDYYRHHETLQAIVDDMARNPNIEKRLADIQKLYKDANRMLIDARDKAAYEIRSHYAGQEAEHLAGVSRRYINYWAKRWQQKNALPPLKARKRIDLSNVPDISGGGSFTAAHDTLPR